LRIAESEYLREEISEELWLMKVNYWDVSVNDSKFANKIICLKP